MDDIPRVRGLSEAEFVERFLIPNRPCILTDVVPRWRIYREWRTFDRFVELFGDVEVPACVCTGDVECGADSFEGSPTVREVLGRSFYLKDWHMQQQLGDDAVPYDPPSFLGGLPLFDWINGVEPGQRRPPPSEGDEYRFCYVGLAGSGTGLHMDVMASYSWSANLVGRKRWTFFHEESLEALMTAQRDVLPIAHGDLLRDAVGRLVGLRGDAAQGAGPLPEAARPRIPEALLGRRSGGGRALPDFVEVVQEPGELIFVPSCWAHIVENLTDAISINHNWINAGSLRYMWDFLLKEHGTVKRELAEWGLDGTSDFEAQALKVLKANCKLDFETLAGYVRRGRQLLESDSRRRAVGEHASCSCDRWAEFSQEQIDRFQPLLAPFLPCGDLGLDES